jgi:signal transduction histidine kinase
MSFQRLWLTGIVVLALSAVINVVALDLAEDGFRELRSTAAWVTHTQHAQTLIEHLLRLAVDAETGQRGYLMSGREAQLDRFAAARNELPDALRELAELTNDNPVQVSQLETVRALIDARLEVLAKGIELKRAGDEAGLSEWMQRREGKIAMDSLRLALDGMANEERMLYERRFHTFEQSLRLAHWALYLIVGTNIFLVSLGAVFLGQDSRRRRREAREAELRNAQLAQTVLDRTAELAELSHYLQRMQEDERARIAREIHDELGGTLAAAKIDLQMLANKLAPGHDQQIRLSRAMAAIDDAVQVKRRIIEDLRPSVLDNLGIGQALKWQCAEFAKRSGIPCHAELYDEHLVLAPATSIAMFRVLQEALTNVGKHAGASHVAISLRRDGERWVLRIADDGAGIDRQKARATLGHGLVMMRERARALGGEFSAATHGRRGTVVELRLPAEKIETQPEPRPEPAP